MKKLKFIFGKLSILYYILFLLVTCVLCKYGSIRQLKFAFLALGILLVLSLCIWIGCLIAEKENPLKMKGTLRKTVFGTELLILLVVTVGCISYIVYTAIPYNGALSWKVDSLFKTKKIEYEHNNFFRDGAEGLIKDINKKLKLPDELYITDSFEMSFDKGGTITRVSAYLYGQNEKGKDKTYLIDYDIDKSDKIVVQIAGYANADYDDDKKLDPMFTILEKSDCKMQVTQWNLNYAFTDNPPEYEILYYGKRSFASSEGLVYLPGDVDGDGEVSGMTDFTALDSGGEALGYEVSVALPPLNYGGHPYHHIGMPGTVIMSEEVVRETIIYTLAGLWDDGFRKFILVNNHGHKWMLEAAVQEFYKRFNLPAIVSELEWHRAIREFWIPIDREDSLTTHFIHADEAETAVANLLFPEMVDMSVCVDAQPVPLTLKGHYDTSVDSYSRPHTWSEGEGQSKIERFGTPDGIVGYPSRGDAYKAKRPILAICRYIVKMIDDILADFPAGTAPVDGFTFRDREEIEAVMKEPLSEGWKSVHELQRFGIF